ncbi:hypothetical protein [Micromonospora arida]
MSFRASGLFARRLVITLATIVALVAIAAGAVYTWPLDDDDLTPASQRFTFAAATARAAAQARAEEADLGIPRGVPSPCDRFIDLKRATSVPAATAEANGICLRSYEIPPEANVGHEAIDLASLGPAKDAFYLRYIDRYEGLSR